MGAGLSFLPKTSDASQIPVAQPTMQNPKKNPIKIPEGLSSVASKALDTLKSDISPKKTMIAVAICAAIYIALPVIKLVCVLAMAILLGKYYLASRASSAKAAVPAEKVQAPQQDPKLGIKIVEDPSKKV